MSAVVMIAVEGSSQVKAYGYEPNSAKLFVTFVGGTMYRYDGVEADVWADFLEAESKGKFLNAVIKRGGYAYTKLTAAEAQAIEAANAPIAIVDEWAGARIKVIEGQHA